MSYGLYQFARRLALSAFYVLSCVGVMLGALLCLMKSPESQSLVYLAQTEQYQQQAIKHGAQEALILLQHSEKSILTALSYTPYDIKMWNKLDDIKQDYTTLSNINKAQNLALSDID